MRTSVLLLFISCFLLAGCSTLIQVPQTPSDLSSSKVDLEFIKLIEPLLDSTKMPVTPEVVCGNIPIPRYLKELNMNDVFTSNVSLSVNSSLDAYGFSGTMGKRDILIVSYLTKYKNYNCGNDTKRALVGIKLFVHASEVKIKASSPTLPMIAAAVELGLAKAEYRFQTFGINPDDFYARLPSAQFTVDTYSKVISSYDIIIHSLKDSTEIDPVISNLPKHR